MILIFAGACIAFGGVMLALSGGTFVSLIVGWCSGWVMALGLAEMVNRRSR